MIPRRHLKLKRPDRSSSESVRVTGSGHGSSKTSRLADGKEQQSSRPHRALRQQQQQQQQQQQRGDPAAASEAFQQTSDIRALSAVHTNRHVQSRGDMSRAGVITPTADVAVASDSESTVVGGTANTSLNANAGSVSKPSLMAMQPPDGTSVSISSYGQQRLSRAHPSDSVSGQLQLQLLPASGHSHSHNAARTDTRGDDSSGPRSSVPAVLSGGSRTRSPSRIQLPSSSSSSAAAVTVTAARGVRAGDDVAASSGIYRGGVQLAPPISHLPANGGRLTEELERQVRCVCIRAAYGCHTAGCRGNDDDVDNDNDGCARSYGVSWIPSFSVRRLAQLALRQLKASVLQCQLLSLQPLCLTPEGLNTQPESTVALICLLVAQAAGDQQPLSGSLIQRALQAVRTYQAPRIYWPMLSLAVRTRSKASRHLSLIMHRLPHRTLVTRGGWMIGSWRRMCWSGPQTGSL